MQRTHSFGSVLGMTQLSTPINPQITQRTGNATPVTCGLYIAKICTGAGLLGLPRVYYDSGVISASIMTIILVLLNIVSCRILIRCRDIMLVGKYHQHNHTAATVHYDMDYSNDTYNQLAEYTLGTIGLRIVDISIIICLLGVVALYIITYCELMYEVINTINKLYYIVCALIFLLPFSLIRELNFLSFVSALSTISYVIAFICIFTYGYLYGHQESIQSIEFTKFGSSESLGRSFGMLTFSLGIPVMSLTLEEELQQPTKFHSILNRSMFVVCVSYITIGCIGCILFDHVHEIIISNLSNDSIITGAVKLMVAVTLLLSCPLSLSPALNLIEHLCCHRFTNTDIHPQNHSVRSNTYGAINNDTASKDHNTYHTVFTLPNLARIVVLLIVTAIAFTIPCFQLLMSVLGCITFSLLCFILPSIMYIQLHRFGDDLLHSEYVHSHSDDSIDHDTNKPFELTSNQLQLSTTSDWSIHTHAVLNYMFIIIGVVVSAVATYEVISNAKCV